ncbi:S8 family serine peptidase [Isoptericola sp. NPDC056605]|uniref:S8 family peptidase n=1 Tax=Isoptericola sp. NPDC056605 TaxID=3345876 RepID=UPI003683BB17
MLARTPGITPRVALVCGAFIAMTAVSGCSTAEPPIRVAIVDSGVAADLDAFKAYTIASPTETVIGGHGTMMASVALGTNGNGAEPVDPELVEVLSINIDGRSGDGEALAEGIVAAVDDGADIILVSRGVRRDTAALRSAVERAGDAGSVVVAAAGNVRFLTADYPARYPDVISVGAATRDGQPWSHSAKEPVDTFALGVDVSVLDEHGAERVESGTSVAAALVVRDLLGRLADKTIPDPSRYEPPKVVQPAT